MKKSVGSDPKNEVFSPFKLAVAFGKFSFFGSDPKALLLKEPEVPTVSFHDIPPFDLLVGSIEPFEGSNGALLSEASPLFAEVVAEARTRVNQTFEVDVPKNLLSGDCLEHLIREMWSEGWNPAIGDVPLFVRDFGALLAQGILNELGGLPVFRSLTDLSHMSVWWPTPRIETFPFHKMYKRMTHADGESLTYYVTSLTGKVRQQQGE